MNAKELEDRLAELLQGRDKEQITVLVEGPGGYQRIFHVDWNEDSTISVMVE